MTSLLRPGVIAVETSGELVLLKISDLRASMEFSTALELSAALKSEARAAKRCAGDDSHRYSTMGALRDAAADSKRRGRFATKLPERLAAKSLRVTQEGVLVALTINRVTAHMPYQAALQLSQWLRVRGKQARNAAGESAHWSRIVTGEAVAVG